MAIACASPLHIHQCGVRYHDRIIHQHTHGMIIAARTYAAKAIPSANITINVAKMENTNPLPINNSVLKPIKKSNIATTVIWKRIRLAMNPRFATATRTLDHKWGKSISFRHLGCKPIYLSFTASGNISTTFPFGTVEIAIPIAGSPFTHHNGSRSLIGFLDFGNIRQPEMLPAFRNNGQIPECHPTNRNSQLTRYAPDSPRHLSPGIHHFILSLSFGQYPRS